MSIINMYINKCILKILKMSSCSISNLLKVLKCLQNSLFNTRF